MRYRAMAMAFLLATVGVACEDEDDDETPVPLASGPAEELAVRVVQSLEEGDNETTPEPKVIYTDSQSAIVAYAGVSQDVVPIAFADASADPVTDVLQVTVDIEDQFLEDIEQVELTIQVGSSGASWCEPMKRDELDDSLFYLRLQPACSAPSYRDPLTNDCVLVADECGGEHSAPCREDLLTFTLWGDITSDCHEQATSG